MAPEAMFHLAVYRSAPAGLLCPWGSRPKLGQMTSPSLRDTCTQYHMLLVYAAACQTLCFSFFTFITCRKRFFPRASLAEEQYHLIKCEKLDLHCKLRAIGHTHAPSGLWRERVTQRQENNNRGKRVAWSNHSTVTNIVSCQL